MITSRCLTFRRIMATSQRRMMHTASRHSEILVGSRAVFSGTALIATVLLIDNQSHPIAKLEVGIPSSGDIIMVEPSKEKTTGILFPKLCNGFSLAGMGVRYKWGFVQVYAVGSYFDPNTSVVLKGSSKEAIEKALLDPKYSRTIRIVMARNLSIQKFTDALNESLEPRMNGEDLEKLEEFRKLNPTVDLIKGAEMELTIRGDTLLYKNATGAVGIIRSAVFTRALCDVYFGKDAVSPTLKESVLDGILKL